MPKKRKPARRKAKKEKRELAFAEAGVKSAQDAFAKILAIADPESAHVKK